MREEYGESCRTRPKNHRRAIATWSRWPHCAVASPGNAGHAASPIHSSHKGSTAGTTWYAPAGNHPKREAQIHGSELAPAPGTSRKGRSLRVREASREATFPKET